MLNRPLLGLVAGGLLGVLDGLSSLVSAPEVSEQIAGIVIGSSMKGLVAGLLIGLVARKLSNPTVGLAIGTGIALAVTAPIAHMNATFYGDPTFYWKIMLPGALVGAIVGYATVTYGRPPKATSSDGGLREERQ